MAISVLSSVSRPSAVRPAVSARRDGLRQPRVLSTVQAVWGPPVTKAHDEAPAAINWGGGAMGVLLSAAVVVLPCCQGKPAAAADFPAPQVKIGEGVFNMNCAACHTGGQNAIQAEQTLEKDALVEYLDGGFEYDAILKQVINGKGAMPAWSGSLSEDQIKAVAAYVYTQADKALW